LWSDDDAPGNVLSDPAVAGVLSNDGDEYIVAYEFERGKDGQREDSITCARRLADEVAWYFFVVAGTAYYASGNYLLRSRARMLVTPGAEGIEQVTFKLDESPKKQDTVTVVCRADRWQAPPGSRADVDGYGAADGAWLVGDIDRAKLFVSNLTTITLVAAQKKKLEPAHQTKQRKADAPDDPLNLDYDANATTTPGSKATMTERGHAIAPADAPQKVKAIIQAGNKIVGKIYKYGAAHGSSLDQIADAYDCSSSISFMLHAADLLGPQAVASGPMASMFLAGPGEWVTIHANDTHVYMHVAGLVWNTHGDGPVSGIGWHKTNASGTAGFAVRHPRGL
jgi:hypothetical protein